MKQLTGFSLHRIQQIPYLLPFGQAVADRRRGIRLNETGVFIWNTLKTECSRQELLQKFFAEFEVSDEQKPEVIRDIDQFLAKLSSLDMISPLSEKTQPPESTFYIGGLTLAFSCPKEALPLEFLPFSCEKDTPADCTVTVHAGPSPNRENGTVLLRNRELVVMERHSDYLLLFPGAQRIWEGSVAKDGSQADFYVLLPADDSLKADLFHAIRLAFLYIAQKRGLFAIHSASICYRGKAWIFSGRSGMGKSTHTNLWHEHLGTPLLNGDLNLMELSKEGPVVHGIPWCGTSGIFSTETLPLGGIVLLGRSIENEIKLLPAEERALRVMHRLISPSWTNRQLSDNLAFSEALTAKIPVCRFKCTKSTDAVDVMRRWIDEH